MAHNTEIEFPDRLFTLQQLVSRRPEFPIVVKTRNRLPSFKQVPIEEEGKLLFMESKVALTYARIKVLKFQDEKKITPERGAEFNRSHSLFVGEEFYIPLGCPGTLRIIPYPGTRRRYVTVSEVMQENPRYLQSKDDIMAVPPRNITDHHCLTCIPAGTIIEPKTIVHQNKVRYLKCADRKGRCFYLREDCRANFTSVLDIKQYTLQQIWDDGILLPTPIQFIPGTISPHDVVLFHDDMASNNLVIINGPLEVLEIVTIKTLIAKARDSERGCFKTLLLPQTVYETFHVQQAEFRTFELKSRFVERKFGDCQDKNDFICNKMYLMPAAEDLVCWLRNPMLLTSDANYCESSDSDFECADTLELHLMPKAEAPPPIPEKRYIQNQEKPQMRSTILLPTAKIQDQEVLQKVKDKSKLGFGKVHRELKRFFRRKPLKTTKLKSDISLSAIKDFKDDSVRSKTHSPKQTHTALMHSKLMKETKVPTSQTSKNKMKSSHKTRAPLSSLPEGTSLTATPSSDDEIYGYNYIDIDTLLLPPSNSEETKVTTNQTSENKMKSSQIKRAPLPSLPQGTSLTAIDLSDDEVYGYNYIDFDTMPLPPSNSEETKVTTNQMSENKMKSSQIKRAPLPSLPQGTSLTAIDRSDDEVYGYNYIDFDTMPLPPLNSEETKVTTNQTSENKMKSSHIIRAPLPSLPQGTSLTAIDSSKDYGYGFHDYIDKDTLQPPPSNSEETKVTTNQTSDNKMKSSHIIRAPLPFLPQGTSLTAIDSSDDDGYGFFDYIEIDTLQLPLSNSEDECKKLTALVEPITMKHQANSKSTPQTSAVPRISEACRSDFSNRQPSVVSNREPSYPLSPTQDSIDVTQETNSENVYYLTPFEEDSKNENQKPHHLINIDFFSYSIEETIDCLKYCGLEHIAYKCKDQILDGEFFENTDEVLIKELLNLSGLDVLKLRKIYNGWRPKYN